MRHPNAKKTMCSFLIAFVAAFLLAATPSAARKKGPPVEKRLRPKVSKLKAILSSAKRSADRIETVAKENQKYNNYVIARDDLVRAQKQLQTIIEIAGDAHPTVVEMKQLFDETSQYVKQKIAPIREKILAKEKAPKDVYKGKDRAKIKSMIKSAWKKAYPKDKILAIRFHQANWKRTKTRRWNDTVNEWQYNDVSSLAVSVIVKSDERVATIYVAFVNKDHISGAMRTGVATKTGGYIVREMLIANLK